MSVKFKDYYETLGVQRTVSPDELKQAYRRLAKQLHPDLHPESDKAAMTEKFKAVNEAYEVLADPEKRAKYDQLGADWREGQDYSPPPGAAREGRGFEGEGGFSDFFESLFGGSRDAEGFGPEPAERDVEALLPLSLEEALAGGERRVSLELPEPCARCGGFGRAGRGLCPACAGLGETRRRRDVTVRLPKTLHDGARIRLKGQGAAAPSGPAGDLYLKVRLQPHPLFRAAGSDLETTVRVQAWDAVLGGSVSVPTPEGGVTVRIPAGFRAGQRLRLAAKGLPRAGAGRGDLYAVVELEVPGKTSPEQEGLWRKLKEAG